MQDSKSDAPPPPSVSSNALVSSPLHVPLSSAGDVTPVAVSSSSSSSSLSSATPITVTSHVTPGAGAGEGQEDDHLMVVPVKEDVIKDLTDFVCSICSCLAWDPVQTPCDHVFCSQCIRQWLNRPSVRSCCPLDRLEMCDDQLQSLRESNPFAFKILGRVEVFCIRFHRAGCDWKGEYTSAWEHITRYCSYTKVFCKYCQIQMQRRHVTLHESSECSLRPITCDYCMEQHAYNQHQEHTIMCPAAPITCDGPNGCGQTMLRSLLSSHLRHECIRARVACPLMSHGCTASFDRSDMNTHMQQAAIQHVMMLAERLEEERRERLKLEESVEELMRQLMDERKITGPRSPSSNDSDINILSRPAPPSALEDPQQRLSHLDLSIGTFIDVRDSKGKWLEGEILEKRHPHMIYIHYLNWSEKWDEWVDVTREPQRVAPFHSLSSGDRPNPYKPNETVLVYYFCPKPRRWATGVIWKVDRSQVSVRYTVGSNVYQRWFHVESDEIDKINTQAPSTPARKKLYSSISMSPTRSPSSLHPRHPSLHHPLTNPSHAHAHTHLHTHQHPSMHPSMVASASAFASSHASIMASPTASASASVSSALAVSSPLHVTWPSSSAPVLSLLPRSQSGSGSGSAQPSSSPASASASGGLSSPVPISVADSPLRGLRNASQSNSPNP